MAFGLVLAAALFLVAAPASAQTSASEYEGRGGNGRAHGIGGIVGDPLGVTGKHFLGMRPALNWAIGFGLLEADGIDGHVDFLWHAPLASFDRARMDLHFGVGPGFAYFESGGGCRGEGPDRDCFDGEDNVWVGARAPVGLTFPFTERRLDVFLEVAPKLWIIEDVEFDIDAAAGARFWF